MMGGGRWTTVQEWSVDGRRGVNLVPVRRDVVEVHEIRRLGHRHVPGREFLDIYIYIYIYTYIYIRQS